MAADHQHLRSIFRTNNFIILLFSLVLVLFATAAMAKPRRIVETLPGFPGQLPFKLETGYVGVGKDDDVQLFYYFIESEGNPKKDPLMLWLTGGPGCSSLTGLVYEIGPLTFDYEAFDGNLPTFLLNPYSWTKFSNIIFLDAPVGSGFSYAKTSQAYNLTDTISAAQTYEFLRKWLWDHPEFLSNMLYVGGDSYSGLIVPMIIQKIYTGNVAGRLPSINLNGFVLGNPVTDMHSDFNSRVKYAHGMALISDEIYEEVRKSCHGEYVNVDPNNIKCLQDYAVVYECINKLDPAQILEPNCAIVSSKSNGTRWNRALLEEDPMDILSWSQNPPLWCRTDTYLLSYIWCNDESVQDALDVRKGTITIWVRCNRSMSYTENVFSTVDYHRYLTKTYYRSLIYSGDHDLLIPYVGTLEWIRSLNMSVTDTWQPWFVDGQVGGYKMNFEKNHYHMTYATVKGGGHTAPEYRPKEAFAMAKRWFSNYPL